MLTLSSRPRRTFPLLLAAEAGLLVAVLYLSLDGWRRDFDVPIQFSGDAIEYLIQSKGTIDDGWWWVQPRLSAPRAFWQIAYPSNANVDQAVVWIVSRFTRDVGLCVNVCWMAMIALSGVITTAWLRRLGLSPGASLLGGVLFGLSPYSLFRGLGHFSLLTYLVPFPCAAALLVASGRLDRLRTPVGVALVVGSALIGFNYVYYAFFGCGLLVSASAAAWFRRKGARAVRAGLLLVATTVAATVLNLAPSVYVWSVRGRPLQMEENLPLQSEMYGLRLRQLLTPLPHHLVGFLDRWAQENDTAYFPVDNENTTTRLGILGVAGFVLVLWRLLLRGEESAASLGGVEWAAGLLTVVALVWGTTGGLGSLFNLLVVPDIRAYNRIFPFIHFFALVGLGAGVDRLSSRVPSRWSAIAGPALAGALLALGVFDQHFALAGTNLRYAGEREEMRDLRRLVAAMESALPPGAKVFEVPVVSFPSDDGNEDMDLNDPGKPFLVSRTLRWSFPAFDDDVARWQRQVGGLPLPQMAAAARAAGFVALFVDRFGYADGAARLLASPGVSAATIVEGPRYVVLDLRKLPGPEPAPDGLPTFGRTFGPASIGLPPCRGDAPHAIDRVGTRPNAFAPGGPDTPTVPLTPAWSDFTVSGWAADGVARRPARDVDLVVDGRVFPTFYGVSRPDVATRFGNPDLSSSGFTTRVPRPALRRGELRLSLRIVAADGACYYETSPRTIRVL